MWSNIEVNNDFEFGCYLHLKRDISQYLCVGNVIYVSWILILYNFYPFFLWENEHLHHLFCVSGCLENNVTTKAKF